MTHIPLPPDAGLIPAWAGKTPLRAHRSARRWAHPRVGGENVQAVRAVDPFDGSSPRGRGKRMSL